MTVFKTAAYVHGFEAIFRIYPALYAEKSSISTWAMAHTLGWPRNQIGPWKIEKFT